MLYEAEQRLGGTVMDVLTGPRGVEMTVGSDLLLDYVFVSKRVKPNKNKGMRAQRSRDPDGGGTRSAEDESQERSAKSSPL